MASKEPRGKLESKALSLADIRTLAKLVNQFDLSELELKRGEERIRLCRAPQGQQPSVLTPELAHVVNVPVAPAREVVSQQPAMEATDDGTIVITSPFVGTFYRAASPEASPFVEVGQTIKKGQVLCIVEAMKLMNEIEAEADCKILDIHVKNADPVEFGQPLFSVFPLP
jgi:acetyl-CoA carboxylase biotin carboxyl carrier protein